MYYDVEVSPEDEDEMIRKIAEKIHQFGLDVAAVIMIDTFKPLALIGVLIGRIFVSPFLPILGENIGISGEKFFNIFEKDENVEKLIKSIEELSRAEREETGKKGRLAP